MGRNVTRRLPGCKRHPPRGAAGPAGLDRRERATDRAGPVPSPCPERAIPSSPTIARREWPALLLLGATGPLLYAAPLSAAALLPLTAAALRWLEPAGWRRDLAAGRMWLPLVLVMAASAAWAIDGRAALWLALRLAALIGCGVLAAGSLGRLPGPVAGRLLRALGWGLLAAAATMLADLALGGPLTLHLHGRTGSGYWLAEGYSRGNVAQALIGWPLAVGLWRRGARRLALAQLVVGGIAVLAGVQWAAKLALAVGILGGGLVLLRPPLARAVPILLAGLVLALPWLLPVSLPAERTCWLARHKPSALHREIIWNWVDGRIRERPLLGWGLDAARRMPGGHDRVEIEGCPAEGGGARLSGEQLPLHPHNAALQLWLELGALGAVAASLGLLAATWRLLGAGRAASAPAGMLLAGAVVALVSFGIWQEWWLALLLLAGAIARGAAATSARSP